ncbi:MAG: hypothetical protein JW772_00615 [Candidatus Diapherotrites archaeon]|nr:hypothetical protein [Candidatus Diapherotrites archaeon]
MPKKSGAVFKAKKKWRSSSTRRVIRGAFGPSKRTIKKVNAGVEKKANKIVGPKIDAAITKLAECEKAIAELKLRKPKSREDVLQLRFFERESQELSHSLFQSADLFNDAKWLAAKTNLRMSVKYALDALNVQDLVTRQRVFGLFESVRKQKQRAIELGNERAPKTIIAGINSKLKSVLGWRTVPFLILTKRKSLMISKTTETTKS